MAKKPEFYDRYLVAVFRRGRAAVLPEEYLQDQARKVLDAVEMEEFARTLARLIEAGVVERADGGYSLNRDKANLHLASLA